MYYYLVVAMGGAVGAVTRYWLTVLVQAHNPSGFPLGTFLVNVVGSLLIGVCFVLLAEKLPDDTVLRQLLMVGFLGGLTTFSAFSLEALLLLEQGLYNTALLYIVGSVVVCLLAAFIGMQVTRAVL